ncbi:MAG: hypothetical protein KAT26_07315 [Marinosulfonomonas sp.]|nr:hypothetical protein [Marinosulfonomonas sp.]
MKNVKNTVMGVFAPPAKPDWGGFVALGVLYGGPVVALLFAIDVLLSMGG